MSITVIEQNAQPPDKRIETSEYGLLYASLYDAKCGNWLKVTIHHKPEDRIAEIARVRRAVQRWFSQSDNKIYRMTSRVESVDDNTSNMYIFKDYRDVTRK